jgi:hypothetical protein
MKRYKALTFEVDLSGLGKEQWIQEELDYDTIAQKIIDTLIDVMREKDVEASSNLIQSLEPEWQGDEIRIYADYYWKFVDKGVNGLVQNRNSEYSFKFVPASKKHALAMIEWAKFKGMGAITVKEAYQLATSIKLKGIKARNFVDEFEKRIDKIELL